MSVDTIFNFIETYGFTIIVIFLVLFGMYSKIKALVDNNLIEWLVDKVADAEIYFGSQTGQLKLRYVYDAFVNQRPVLAIFISFETFSSLVDAALEKFEDMLFNNKKIQEWYEKQISDHNEENIINENIEDINIDENIE